MSEDSATAAAPSPSTEQVMLTCSAEYNSYPLPASNCWAITSFKAPFYEPTSRASVDIVAVIDKSGSMSGEKIKLVRKTLLFVIDQLKECDRMSLVTYDSSVVLNFPLTKMDKANKDRAKSIVEGVHEGSCTNLCGGLLKGMEQVAKSEDKAKVQSVLLLTDGLANEGITGTANIINEIKKFQEEGLGAISMGPSGQGRQQLFMPQQRQRQVQQPQAQARQGFFGWLFGNRAPAAPQQQAPPPIQQQQGPPPMLQQQQQAPPLIQQQQQAPPLVPQANVANVAPPLVPQIDQDNVEDMEVDVPDEDPKPKPSGPKFEGTIYTFGFGSDHDATLLEAISTQGGGVYYYIDSNEKIPESFADCLGGLLSVVGQNLSLKLELQGGNSVSEVHANRAITWATPNKTCEIGMGDLQSEEERDIVLELQLPAVSSPQQDLVLKASLSYFNVITSALDTVTCDLIVDRKDGDQGPAKESVDVQRNRILATSALKKAEAMADSGKLEDARKLLNETIKRLEQSASAKQDFCKALISDLKKSLESMQSRERYLGHGKLYMHSKAQAHSVQRSNFVDDTSYYQTSSKVAMRSKSKW